MGLADAEFWRMTPRKYVALLRVHERLLEREDWRTATICAVVANTVATKRKKPFQPKDFMPGEARVQSPDAIRDKAHAFAHTFGLEVKQGAP